MFKINLTETSLDWRELGKENKSESLIIKESLGKLSSNKIIKSDAIRRLVDNGVTKYLLDLNIPNGMDRVDQFQLLMVLNKHIKRKLATGSCYVDWKYNEYLCVVFIPKTTHIATNDMKSIATLYANVALSFNRWDDLVKEAMTLELPIRRFMSGIPYETGCEIADIAILNYPKSPTKGTISFRFRFPKGYNRASVQLTYQGLVDLSNRNPKEHGKFSYSGLRDEEDSNVISMKGFRKDETPWWSVELYNFDWNKTNLIKEMTDLRSWLNTINYDLPIEECHKTYANSKFDWVANATRYI